MMRLVTLSLLLVGSLTMTAQTAIRDVFKQMPANVVPYLVENNRLDFIDFIDSDMKAEVTNAFGGKSEMLKLTDDYLSLRLSDATSMEMRLLEVTEPVDSASQIVCLVTTYGNVSSKAQESVVAFYSLKWQPLPAERYMQLPKEMFVATFGEPGEQEPSLVVTPVCRLDAPANEEQKEINKPSTILKWRGGFVNEN